MNFPHDMRSHFELTRKRPFDLEEHGLIYSRPTAFNRLNFNENYDFSRSHIPSFPEVYQGKTWEHSSHVPLFPREPIAIFPRFQNSSRVFSRGYDNISSQFNDPSHNLPTRYDHWGKSESSTQRFNTRRKKYRKRGRIGKNPTRDFCHKSGKCDSVSPQSQVRASENPRVTIGKVKLRHGSSRKSDSIRTSEKPKEGLLAKVNTTRDISRKVDLILSKNKVQTSENPNEGSIVKENPKSDSISAGFQAKASENSNVGSIPKVNPKSHLLTKCENMSSLPENPKEVSPVKTNATHGTKSTVSRDNFKIRKVSSFRQFPTKIGDLTPRITKRCNGENLVIKRDSFKASNVSTSGVLKSDSTTPKVVNVNKKGIEPESKVDDVEEVVNKSKADVMIEGNESNLKVDDVEEVLNEVKADDNFKSIESISTSAPKKFACTRSFSKYPPPRRGFSAIRDWPLKFGTQKNQVCSSKDDVAPIGEQSQSGVGAGPTLENALKDKVYDKPLECGVEEENKKEIKSPFLEQHHENVCAKDDVDMIDAPHVSNCHSMPNQENIEASFSPFVDTSAENLGHFSDLNMVSFGDCKIVSDGKQVKEVLDLYEQVLEKLLENNKTAKYKISKQVHLEAAMLLKKDKQWVNTEPILGHVPGVEVGDRFRFRAELVCIGLHRNFQNSIDYIQGKNGKILAASIVSSGCYENDDEFPDVLHYCGQGENKKPRKKIQPQDQKLEKGNLALKNSMEAKTPVRVIHRNNNSVFSYYYDGLYLVSKVTQETSKYGKLVYMFVLNRIKSSEPNSTQVEKIPFFVGDISLGKEKIPICVINIVDDEEIPPFTYISRMQYPDSCYSKMCGCDCSDGCLNIKKCQCVLKNGSEVFDANGSIIIEAKSKRFIHECGSSCKCPSSCKNRVSQHGIRFELEIFKTKSMGWGVRSRNYIPAGSFICEYVGEFLQGQEAEQRSNNDEYLFDIDDGYTIDAAKYGNVGRFINHSCSPNLYAQYVLFDHDKKRMPHVMFFAVNGIFPFQELTYDYNYKVDSVTDGEGNIKKKACHCGSRCCSGRLY